MKKIDISKNIMNKIETGSVKMKPKIFFVAGAVLMGLGFGGFLLVSIFFANLFIYDMRTYRLISTGRIWNVFPWEYLALAVIGLVGGIWLLKKTDIGYKKSVTLILGVLFTLVLFTAYGLEKAGFNEHAKNFGPMKGIYMHRGLRMNSQSNPQNLGTGKQQNSRNFQRNRDENVFPNPQNFSGTPGYMMRENSLK